MRKLMIILALSVPAIGFATGDHNCSTITKQYRALRLLCQGNDSCINDGIALIASARTLIDCQMED